MYKETLFLFYVIFIDSTTHTTHRCLKTHALYAFVDKSIFSFSYSIDKLGDEKVFSLSLSMTICIDKTCDEEPLLQNFKVPIPLCNTNFTSFRLPGDGTIQGFVKELGGKVASSAVDVVINRLGLSVGFKFQLVFRHMCSL